MGRLDEQPRKKKDRLTGEPYWRQLEKTSAVQTFGKDMPRPNKSDGTSFGDRMQRECKSTVSASLSLKRAWLEKLQEEAKRKGKHPLLVIGFERPGDGQKTEWGCLPLPLLVQLVEASFGGGNASVAK